MLLAIRHARGWSFLAARSQIKSTTAQDLRTPVSLMGESPGGPEGRAG